MTIYSKLIFRFNKALNTIQQDFVEIEKQTLKYTQKMKGLRTAKVNLKKNTKIRRLTLKVQNNYKAIIINEVMY